MTRLPLGPWQPPASRDLGLVAPRFAAAVAEGLSRARLAGLDPVLFEAYRSPERQEWLWSINRTIQPIGYEDGRTVTNARWPYEGWHPLGLAADIISAKHEWDSVEFFLELAAVLKPLGLAWGGDWRHRDLPHFQWAKCAISPTERSKTLYQSGGLPAVWQAVGAL